MNKLKYVRYIRGTRSDLTTDKIYDVVDNTTSSIGDERILIVNDMGEERWYVMVGSITNNILFLDAIEEYRTQTIEEILL